MATVSGSGILTSQQKASVKYRRSEYGKQKRAERNLKYRSTPHGHIQKAFANARLRADKLELPFTITVEFLEQLWEKQNGRCAITDVEMTYGKGNGRRNTSGSLDRIVPENGYTKENVRFLCDAINMMKNNKTDEEFRQWCLKVTNGLKPETVLVPNLNTFADLVDRLVVEVNKLAYFENKKREAHKSGHSNPTEIAYWDNKSRDACEYRSMLKNEINRMLTEVCESGEYKTLNELRTFAPPDKSIADILAAKCMLAPNFIKQIINDRG